MRTWPRGGLLLLMWGCLSGLLGRPLGLAEHPREPEGRFGGTYRRALANNSATLDPAFVHDIDSRTVVTPIAEGLIHFDAHLNPIPAIAEFWEASRDGRIWTFCLRQGVQFHHGREVTAQDVVDAFTRLLSPHALGSAIEFFCRMQGAEAFIQGTTHAVQGLRALARYTLPITLTEPCAPSLTVLGLANTAVIPQEGVERLGARFAQAPVGAGPFTVGQWDAGKAIVLQAHEQYYEGRLLLDTVVFTIGETFEQTFAQFVAGHLDETSIPASKTEDETSIPASKTEEVRQDPRYRPYHFLRRPTLGLLYLGLNTQVKPFDDKRVRQVCNYAVNKEAIVREITKMGSLPATGALPPGTPGYDLDLPGYAYDPVKAKRLLAEAGFPNGTGFPVVQLWTVSKAQNTQAELAAYQRSLAELGMTLEIHFTDDWTRDTDLLRRGELQMFRYAWYADHPDSDNFLFPLLHSTGQANYMGYRNPRVDQLLEQARQENDYARRVTLYREAERLVMEDAPWITQPNHSFEYLYQPYVHGVEVSLLGDRWIPMNKIWLQYDPAELSAGTVPQCQDRTVICPPGVRQSLIWAIARIRCGVC